MEVLLHKKRKFVLCLIVLIIFLAVMLLSKFQVDPEKLGWGLLLVSTPWAVANGIEHLSDVKGLKK